LPNARICMQNKGLHQLHGSVMWAERNFSLHSGGASN
jgi:hypothetical protein